MATINLPGILSGIDTGKIVEQLMIVNGRRLANYKLDKIGYEDQSTAISALEGKVNALKSVVSSISDAEGLETFRTSTSDSDIVTLSTSSNASAGSHTIEVNQLATTETWLQDESSFNYTTDFVGGGNFIYSYNNRERVITTVDNETTLEDLVNLINQDENNPGVTASILYQGGKYHLMLNGEDAGENYEISVNTSDTELWGMDTSLTDESDNARLSTKITELDQFSGTLGVGDGAYITVSGKQHDGTSVSQNFDVTENSTIEQLLDAIDSAYGETATAYISDGKIKLTDNTCGTGQMEFDLTYNAGSGTTSLDIGTVSQVTQGGGTTADIADLAPSTFIQTQSAQNSKIRVDNYPPVVQEVQTLTPDAPATDGTFTLSYGGQTTEAISYDATTSEIQTALEALSTVDSGDITVSGDSLDTNPVGDGLVFTFAGTEGDVNTLSFDFSSLTGTTQSGSSIAETTQGRYEWITNNSNTITDAIAGVTLSFHDVTAAGETVKVGITKNTGAIKSKIESVISAFNDLVSFVKEKTGYIEEKKQMGILASEIALGYIDEQIRNPFSGVVPGFNGQSDTFYQASDIGITINGEGMMELDSDELEDAISEDYNAVVNLLGAQAVGETDGDVIEFYGASDKYTTAGTYDVEVVVLGGVITSAKIKLSSESTWRDATWSENLVSGDSSFADGGGPLYAENGLQLTVDLSADRTYTDAVRVKQGCGGRLEDILEELLDNETGQLGISSDAVSGKIDRIEDDIEDEQDRLDRIQERLTLKYARLERTLAALQQQMSSVNMLSQLVSSNL